LTNNSRLAVSIILLILFLLPIINAVELENRLEKHVYVLSEEIGVRNAFTYQPLELAADYIVDEFEKIGYDVQILPYSAGGRLFKNIQAEKKGDDEIIIIGAHYDTVRTTPGADDNAAGVAVLLELARLMAKKNITKTIRFVAFSTEEPPFFKTNKMGSFVYASSLEDERIVGMISLEMVGYYSDQPYSQNYPLWYGLFRPSQGNFIGIISDFRSRQWKDQVTTALTQSTDLPVESIWLFRWIPGTDWSDHWSFWQYDYPALMITDSGPYRNPHYHQHSDTYEKLDYDKMAKLTRGLDKALNILAK